MRNQGTYTPNAGWIRTELQRNLLSAASPRVRFVGLKEYTRAGGKIEEDLFASLDDRSIHICDVTLLNELASKKLQAVKRNLGKEWRWLDTMLEADWDVTRQFGRVKGTIVPPTDDERAQHAALTAEIDQLKEHVYTLDDNAKNADDRARTTTRIEAARSRTPSAWTPQCTPGSPTPRPKRHAPAAS